MNKYREARKAAGLTQKEMADLLGIPKEDHRQLGNRNQSPAEGFGVWKIRKHEKRPTVISGSLSCLHMRNRSNKGSFMGYFDNFITWGDSVNR